MRKENFYSTKIICTHKYYQLEKIQSTRKRLKNKRYKRLNKATHYKHSKALFSKLIKALYSKLRALFKLKMMISSLTKRIKI